MDAFEDTEIRARQIQRDIERTRDEMDQTLTELERRLAPSEILHQGAETVREGFRTRATAAIETLKRHPAPIVLAAALLGARFAFRPSIADLRRRQAQQDVERAWSLLGLAFERAKEQSQLGAATLEQLGRLTGERTWRTLQRATAESRAMSRVLRREAGAHPLGAFVLFGLGAGMAMLGARGLRAGR